MSENFMDEDIFIESDQDGHACLGSKYSKYQPNSSDKDEPANSNTGYKNKYINRIKDIAPQGSIISILKKESCVDGSVKSVDKKERNKQAAKNSRDRKKLYIEIMEEKKRVLEKQLESKKRQLEQSKNYYERILSQNKTMSNFAANRHQMIKKLQILLENAHVKDPNQEINEIIDNLRSRIGATGKERINTINEYFRQIVNLSLPALHRYMMWSAAEKKHLFADNEEDEAETEEWFKELKTSLNLTEEQKRQIQNKRKFLQEQKILLEALIEQLKSVKDDIEKKSIELDDIIDGIRNILTPIQCAHFILFIEKNKYRKELNLCDANPEEEYPLRKLVKRE